jgi:hypothetical protein
MLPAGQEATAAWKLRPVPGTGGSGAGETYYVQAIVRYSIQGHDAGYVTPAEPFTVNPPPSLVLRYGVPMLGQPLATGDTFQIEVTATNNGRGAVRNLKIAFPDITASSGGGQGDWAVVSNSGGGSRLDGNGDGHVGGHVGGDYHAQFLVPLPGDANCDGAVDSLDYLALKAGFGVTTGATWAKADFNGDHMVNVADMMVMDDTFGGKLTILPPPAPSPLTGGTPGDATPPVVPQPVATPPAADPPAETQGTASPDVTPTSTPAPAQPLPPSAVSGG